MNYVHIVAVLAVIEFLLFGILVGIASVYWPNPIIAGIGAVWLAGRLLYRHLYLADPARCHPGFLLTVVPTFVLLAASVVGAITRHAA